MMHLNTREKFLFAGLVVFAGILVVIFGIIGPARQRIKTLSRIIPEKTKTLSELKAKSAEYIELKGRLDTLTQNSPGDNSSLQLVPFIETLTDKLGLAENISSIKPDIVEIDPDFSEVNVCIELHDITLQQLVDLLVETGSGGQNLKIKSLYTKKSNTNPALLNSTIDISSIH